MRQFLIPLCLISSSLFGVVSIAPVDIGATPGYSGNIAGTLSSKSGNTEKNDYALSLRLQYDEGNDYLIWGNLTYNYGKSQGKKNEDKMFAHVRYLRALHDLNEDWCGEFFVQTEQDKFKNIKERDLGGAGVRWRFFNSCELGRGYGGLGAFVSQIRYSDTTLNPNETNTRANAYVAYTKNFAQSSKFTLIGYYQPKVDESADYITSDSAELIVPIYGKLNLSLNAKYAYDSRPPVGVQKKDTSYTTYLVWEF